LNAGSRATFKSEIEDARPFLRMSDVPTPVSVYASTLAVLGVGCLGVVYRNSTGAGAHMAGAFTPEFTSFQRNYLLVYLLCAFSDWLKGPYVYALYEAYGFSALDIAWLFGGGFLSSLVFGTVVGALSDRLGRKTMGIVFCVVYMLSALTKPVNNFWMLMLGRVLSGIATSLLFTTFEAWLITEHRRRGFPEALLTNTFSKVTSGNAAVAILAGFVAQWSAGVWGYAAPFLVAVPCLALAGLLITAWPENYGEGHGGGALGVIDTLRSGAVAIREQPALLHLGVCQCLFESTIYLWVFYWTPAVEHEAFKAAVPYGLIFAAFMASMMVGGALPDCVPSVLTLAAPMHLVAAGSLAASAIWYDNKAIVFLAFVVCEGTVGTYFPVHGTLRSQHIPDAVRASVMNLIRFPMNFIVLAVLHLHLPARTVLWLLAAMQLLALAFFWRFRAALKHLKADDADAAPI
jgi:MFS family permease